jgi:hypothetical protein
VNKPRHNLRPRFPYMAVCAYHRFTVQYDAREYI